jgi:hypothetical protein
MHGFKSAILAEMKNCQNGTFERVHEIQSLYCKHFKTASAFLLKYVVDSF